MAIVTAEDVNLLVWRYLQESGFRHTAFTFAHESAVHSHRVEHSALPQGALVSLVQKGLQYMELEANLNDAHSDVEHDFSPLSADELLSRTPDQLRHLVHSRKRPCGADGPPGPSSSPAPTSGSFRTRSGTHSRDDPASFAASALSDDGPSRPGPSDSTDQPSRPDPHPPPEQHQPPQPQQYQQHVSTEPDERPANADDWPPADVVPLEGHNGEVFFGTWCPTSATMVATGSGDGTARIWSIPSTSKSTRPQPSSVELVHHSREGSSKKDITAISWSHNGHSVATGTYHGDVYVWGREGSLQCHDHVHEGPVLALRWNPGREESIVSGGYDGRIVLSNASDLSNTQTASAHKGAVFDVDWRDATTFASGGTDGNVCMFSTEHGLSNPRYMRGHTNEVNAVAWDPTGTLLASCSDDRTARIWNPSKGGDGDVDMEDKNGQQSGAEPSDGLLHEFTEHTLTVYDLSWAPQSRGAQLATASWDGTVRLWDAEMGRCISTLGKHTGAVYSVAYSPYYSMVASGAHDQHVRVWSARDGSLVRSVKCGAGVFKVGWSKDGGKVVATLADSTALVVNLRHSNSTQSGGPTS